MLSSKSATIRSPAPPSCPRATRLPCACARARPRLDAARRRPPRAEACLHAWRSFSESSPDRLGARAARLLPRAKQASGLSGPADGRTEIHQGLRKIAEARRGVEIVRESLSELADRGLGARQLILDAMDPRQHALDIAVDRNRPLLEGDAGDRGRGVGADARQARKLCFVSRQFSAVTLDDGLGAGVQIARAAVIAKPGPAREHASSGASASARRLGKRARKRSK